MNFFYHGSTGTSYRRVLVEKTSDNKDNLEGFRCLVYVFLREMNTGKYETSPILDYLIGQVLLQGQNCKVLCSVLSVTLFVSSCRYTDWKGVKRGRHVT